MFSRRFDTAPVISSVVNRNITTPSTSDSTSSADTLPCSSSVMSQSSDLISQPQVQPQSSFTPFILPSSNNIGLLGAVNILLVLNFYLFNCLRESLSY